MSRGERAISRVRMHARPVDARLAVAALCILALSVPATLRGQELGDSVSTPVSGPFETAGRAGMGVLTFSPAAPAPSTSVARFVQGDTSSHHGTRAHHVIVGALIGGAVGLVAGIAGDRPGLGSGEMRGGHFHNLWLVTIPLGAGIGALAGLVPRAD